MVSSYSTDLKLELMVTGENAGTWGDNTNNNLNLIQQAIAGYEAVALSDGGTVALVMTDKTISNARNMVIKFTGSLTGASTVTIPDSIEKFYIFDCSAVTGPTNLTIKTASGTGFTLDRAAIYAAYSDGTNLNEISLDTLGGKVAAAQLTPAGSDKQIQFNDNGSFGAIAIGTCGQVLTSDGTSASFQDAASTGISWQTGSIKTTGFTATANEGYFCNTNGGAFTLTLPASPTAGDQVGIRDYTGDFNVNALTIGRNGSNLDGNAADKDLTTSFQSATLIYVDATKGWQVIESGDLSIGFTGLSATGGAEIECGTAKIHVFIGTDTFAVNSLSPSSPANKVEYMVVAGGGGTGLPNSGGGGAGGFQESDGTTAGCYTTSPLAKACGAVSVSAQGYAVTVGAGGAVAPGPGSRGSNGTNSIFSSITSAGGGGGGGFSCSTGRDGGSGGGAGGDHNPPATGGSGNVPPTTPPQGQPGENKGPAAYARGGGGATQSGQPHPTGGHGVGGAGAGTAITTSPVYGAPGPSPALRYYAGGGGVGGGGVGQGSNCYTYTGGGGNANTNGRQGIVILRYKFR
jgi:hypothetical protein